MKLILLLCASLLFFVGCADEPFDGVQPDSQITVQGGYDNDVQPDSQIVVQGGYHDGGYHHGHDHHEHHGHDHHHG